jgi:hypothetical protein
LELKKSSIETLDFRASPRINNASITIENSNIDSGFINSHGDFFTLNDSYLGQFSIENIKNIEIDSTRSPIPNNLEKQELTILNCSSLKLHHYFTSLNLLNSDTKLGVANCNFEKLTISQCELKTGFCYISNTQVRKRLFLDGSNLNDLKIQENSSLDSLNNLINDSAIREIKLRQNSVLPLTLHNNEEEQKVVFYRELKKVANEVGNLSLSDRYEKLALISNYRLRQKEVRHLPFSERFDFFFTYTLPYITSTFNYELWRPIGIFLLMVHPVMTAILTAYLWYGENDISSFPEKLSEWFSLFFYTIIPTHSLKFGDINIPSFISFIMRLYSAYFIYQIVTVSRKFFRKVEL